MDTKQGYEPYGFDAANDYGTHPDVQLIFRMVEKYIKRYDQYMCDNRRRIDNAEGREDRESAEAMALNSVAGMVWTSLKASTKDRTGTSGRHISRSHIREAITCIMREVIEDWSEPY